MRFRTLLPIAALIASTASITEAQSTSFTVTNSGATAYVINGMANPTLTLTRGQTYTFNINTPGHPLDIKTVQGAGTANQYNDGVSAQGVSSGILTFQVPAGAPATLFYQCELHNAMSGPLSIVAPPVPAGGALAAGLLAVFTLGAGVLLLRRRVPA